MVTYLQAYGDLMVETNRWDPVVLERFRSDDLVSGFRGALDTLATTELILQPTARRGPPAASTSCIRSGGESGPRRRFRQGSIPSGSSAGSISS